MLISSVLKAEQQIALFRSLFHGRDDLYAVRWESADGRCGYMPKADRDWKSYLRALLVFLAGSIIARYLARSVLIGAVNMNLQYARLLSVGVKWLVIVLALAMALEHLRIAPRVVELAFGILFGGIVFALALAVGLGSKDLVTKSLSGNAKKTTDEVIEDPLRHL